MRKAIIMFLFLGLFLLSGHAPDKGIEFDLVAYNTKQLGGEYWTNNMPSSFRIYPSDYSSRKIASILDSESTIK